MTIDNIAFILIIVSALFKGVALRNLSNTEWEMAKTQKNLLEMEYPLLYIFSAGSGAFDLLPLFYVKEYV